MPEEKLEKKEADAQNKDNEATSQVENENKELAAEKTEGQTENKTETKEDTGVERPKAFTIGDLNQYVDVRKDLPEIRPGDLVRVSYRVIEGGKERIQIFEGYVIGKKNSGIAKTITVRKTSFGIAVERIFPLNSKLVQKIEVKRHSRVRRAKLYFLRSLSGKKARLKELR